MARGARHAKNHVYSVLENGRAVNVYMGGMDHIVKENVARTAKMVCAPIHNAQMAA